MATVVTVQDASSLLQTYNTIRRNTSEATDLNSILNLDVLVFFQEQVGLWSGNEDLIEAKAWVENWD